jgi:hypothetical protein
MNPNPRHIVTEDVIISTYPANPQYILKYLKVPFTGCFGRSSGKGEKQFV